MSDNSTETPKAKRVKLIPFAMPEASTVSKLIEDKQVVKIDVPATPAKIGKNGKQRKGREARTRYRANSRAAAIALFGGSEKALMDCALEYRDVYFKRANSKGKTKDIFRTVNRTAEAFLSFSPEEFAKLSPATQAAIEAMKKEAAAHPTPPSKRKPRKAKDQK